MIYFDKVTKQYGDTTALETVTLSIAPKEFVSIVGHSGAGKTTLLKLLLAEERPTDGSVFF
jgi:ABC-type ATPase involved in cell division